MTIAKGTTGKGLSGGETGEKISNHIWKDLASWVKQLGLYQETVQSQGRLLKQRLRKVTLRLFGSQIGRRGFGCP